MLFCSRRPTKASLWTGWQWPQPHVVFILLKQDQSVTGFGRSFRSSEWVPQKEKKKQPENTHIVSSFTLLDYPRGKRRVTLCSLEQRKHSLSRSNGEFDADRFSISFYRTANPTASRRAATTQSNSLEYMGPRLLEYKPASQIGSPGTSKPDIFIYWPLAPKTDLSNMFSYAFDTIYQTPPLGQDMTQGHFLSGV